MNIAIITYSCAFNYGAMLQTYGLYSYLKESGHTPTVIDYIPERYNIDSPDYADKAMSRTRLWKYFPVLKPLWKRIRLSEMKTNRSIFRSFLEKNVHLTKRYYSLDELQASPPCADIYITGSDQVWNSDFIWSGVIDEPYYLAFLPDSIPKISYASSFGKNRLKEEERNVTQKYLAKYKSLSVRESSGLSILSNLGLLAAEVADPTILAGPETFRKLVLDKTPQKPFMILFLITYKDYIHDMCREVAEKNGVELITIIPDVYQGKKCRSSDKLVLPTVEEWIGYFKEASYVVTDSFHATAFSIMFERQFSTCTAAGYNGRITNILKKVGLEERSLIEINKEALDRHINIPIDFEKPMEKLRKWQKESREWLDNSITGKD